MQRQRQLTMLAVARAAKLTPTCIRQNVQALLPALPLDQRVKVLERLVAARGNHGGTNGNSHTGKAPVLINNKWSTGLAWTCRKTHKARYLV